MSESKKVNITTQKNNTVNDGGNIIGRDMSISNQTFNIKNLFIAFEKYKNTHTSINEDQISSTLVNDLQLQEALNYLKESYIRTLRIENIMLTNDLPKKILDLAEAQMNIGQYLKAHKLFEDELSGSNDVTQGFFFKQYLITGFIYYCKENDMAGLRSLLIKRENIIVDDPEIDLLSANIFQEICSREADTKNISEQIPFLQNLYDKAPNSTKSLMANSLGLAYRRLGERTNIELLQKAITLFDEGLKYNHTSPVTEVELKDQKAIAHIRIFEFNKDINELIDAIGLLGECIALFPSITDPRDIKLKPRVLNNLGNVYKQMALCLESNKRKNAGKAISYYEKAEFFWDESKAKYEWALLQKNKGEAKYALAKITKDANLLINALHDCISSIKYRTLENSPYQWIKSVDVVLKIVLYLKELNSLMLINELMRENIVSYTRETKRNDSKWSDIQYKNLLNNSEQVQSLFID